METRALAHVEPDTIARPYRPNFILAWLYKLFFSRIEVDPVWVRAVRENASRGTVVYVMRSRSYLDFVALDYFLKRYALPLIRFTSNLGMWILEPMGRGLQQFFARREPEGPALERTVAQGFSALLFMRRPEPPGTARRRGARSDVDYVRILIEQQRKQDRPILLMPQVIVWGKRPDRLHKGVVDQIFGSQEYPGRLRMFAQVFWHFGNAKLRACEPVDLQALLREYADLGDDALVDKIHWMLVTRLDRERRVVLGPMTKGPDRLKQEILRHPRIRAAIEDTARREKRDRAQVEIQTRKDLDRLEARINPVALRWMERLLDWVFHRIYQGIEIDRDGIQRIREAARHGPVVLLPSHKSHIDYLLLSYVFYHHALQCPLIAAGDNLAFWPAGWILRRCGAFFIRRSFKGARLYTTLVDTYVRKILKEGYAIEFFVEGGRSRSGKLLPPKVGLLSMVIDAADAAGVDVAYVPISIGYEKIVEQRSYVEELSGAEKKKEDAGALLSRAPRVLTAKYGRAYLQVGEIVHFNYSPEVRGALPSGEEGEASGTARAAKRAMLERLQARRVETQSLANVVAYEINRVTPVTPTALVATVLLAARRGVPRDDLLARVDALVGDLERAGARFAESLAVGHSPAPYRYRVDAIEQALNVFIDGALIQEHGSSNDAIYQVPDEKRLALDFYKNNLIHFFVPRAMVAVAALTSPTADGGVALRDVRARFEHLAAAFAHEFQFRGSVREAFERALGGLVDESLLVADGIGDDALIRPKDPTAAARLEFEAGLIRNFIASHRIAARALTLLIGQPMAAKDFLKRAMGLGERMFLTGEIQHREAISKSNLENAFAALRDQGCLAGGEGGPQRLPPAYASEQAVTEIEERLARYL